MLARADALFLSRKTDRREASLLCEGILRQHTARARRRARSSRASDNPSHKSFLHESLPISFLSWKSLSVGHKFTNFPIIHNQKSKRQPHINNILISWVQPSKTIRLYLTVANILTTTCKNIVFTGFSLGTALRNYWFVPMNGKGWLRSKICA